MIIQHKGYPGVGTHFTNDGKGSIGQAKVDDPIYSRGNQVLHVGNGFLDCALVIYHHKFSTQGISGVNSEVLQDVQAVNAGQGVVKPDFVIRCQRAGTEQKDQQQTNRQPFHTSAPFSFLLFPYSATYVPLISTMVRHGPGVPRPIIGMVFTKKPGGRKPSPNRM